jgi:anti-anti-sigma regulatory factor
VGLRITGELDTLTGDLLEQRVEELLGERPDVVLDLSEMRVRSASAGLMGCGVPERRRGV